MIRLFFSYEIKRLARTAKELGYKPGWAWYRMLEQVRFFYFDELLLAADILGYRRGWAWQQYQRIGMPDPEPSSQHTTTDPINRALQLVGVCKPFTLEQLKAAYRKKALEAHPDTGGSHEAFLALSDAYQELQAYATERSVA